MKNKLDAERANVDSALDALANKGVQVPEDSSSAALPELIEAVKGTIPEENDVNFYDYDGTLLYTPKHGTRKEPIAFMKKQTSPSKNPNPSK